MCLVSFSVLHSIPISSISSSRELSSTPIDYNVVIADDGTTLSIGRAALTSNGTVVSMAS